MKKIEHFLEVFIFSSRWLLAPLYVGLVGAMALLLFKFGKEFITLVGVAVNEGGPAVIVGVLSLVDIVLVANLLVLIVFAGYDDQRTRSDEAGYVLQVEPS